MIDLTYEALDYRRDRTFVRAGYRVRGSTERGFEVVRDGAPLLSLGPGFRPLRVMRCGVCSTDLARHLLPFDLPQVIGHEVVAVDEGGRRFVVEINASHLARGVPHDCAICRAGLATHCPDRVTLGIDRLPGGFGPWILAPVGACVPVPDDIGDADAVLVEPLAAALQAVTTIAPRPGERIAVLGPRRLGMLVVASLASLRGGFTIAAIVRDPDLAPLARSCGADEVHVVGDDDAALERQFDVVIDTTGSPAGLERAVRLARREVHLKSTHGQVAAGLRFLTELVVDELAIERLSGPGVPAAQRIAGELPPPIAVADSVAGVEAAIRPEPGRERALVRPRGRILLDPGGDVSASPLLTAVATRGLRLSSSRCGDFRTAIESLRTPVLRGIGLRLVTHEFGADDLSRAFAVAESRACIKAVVRHDP